MAVAVVHTTRTNHILAAFDAFGREGPPPALAQLVGTGLPLTMGTADISALAAHRLVVAAEHLATAEAERVTGLFDKPLTFGVGPGRTPTPLSPWTGAEPVKLKPDGVHVTLDRTSAGQPTRILVILAGPGPAPEVALYGQAFAGRKSAWLGVALTEKDRYTVLTLAEGWHGRLEALDVAP